MKLSDIKRNPSNPRIIKDDKFQKLVNSIKEFPKMMSLRPMVIDGNNVVLGGNMRLKALNELGYKEIPDEWVKRADELTEDEQKRFIIADNVGFGEHDWDMLTNEWNADDLEDWGLDIPVDFGGEELDAIDDEFESGEDIETDIVIGDLIEIGIHRLICGDSLDVDVVDRLMDGHKSNLILTDPPFEIDFDYANALLYSENAHVLIFNNDRAIVRQLEKSPFEFKKFFVFNHSGCAIPQEGGNECFLDHILISHELNGKPEVRFNKGEGLRTVIKGEYRRAEEHKHEKPFNLLNSLVKSYSNNNTILLDFFAGGGSLMSVAEQLNIPCYCIELDPKNCQTIVDRLIKLNSSIVVKINGVLYS